jgi:hypothetical protein
MMWGRSRKAKGLVERFVAAINAHDVGAVEALLTEDFTYIDSWREGVRGRDRVMAALRVLAEIDPDFGIEVDTMQWREPLILMSGRVNSRQFGMGKRAVWQITLRGDRISEYQAWAEGGPPPMARMLAPGHVEDMSHRAADKPAIGDADQPSPNPSSRSPRSLRQ